MAIPEPRASKSLILAPLGRDAAVAGALLQEAGFSSAICADLVEFQNALNDQVSFAVVTQEAMRSADLRAVTSFLHAQPAWSDLPFVILTSRGGAERNLDALRLSELLGNVTFLERPFHPTTFISVARTAFKGRQRQYEVLALIEALHEGEERLRTALLAGRLGSWELDLTTRMLTLSSTCKALFGRSGNEPLSYEDLIESIHREDRARVQEAMRATVETASDCAIDYRIVWGDGSIHWAEMRARLAQPASHGNHRLVGVSSDITNRKMAEEVLTHLNETLEQRVRERTAELEAAHAVVLKEIEQRQRVEDQLRQAQKMETLGQLTGGVAHDFNNLLTAVLSNLDLLRKHVPADPRTARLIRGATQGAQRGAALTQRLLAFARHQNLKLEPTNLIDLIRDMTNLIERSIGAAIELRIDLPMQLPLALVDPNQIENALLNLVINARDAMPDGGVLSIEVDRREAAPGSGLDGGQYLRVIVSDTGQGMDAETLRRATEPFFSTKGPGKGTGLGLSMVQGLAAQLNGALRLTSEVRRGTRAELWLPVTTLAAQAKESEPPATVADPAAKITILVVDDDVLIAMSTVDMLEDLGHEVIEAHSGGRALDILRSGRAVDLVITDYSMPEMNGAQLAKAVREIQPDVPILLATGYAELPSGVGADLPRIGKPYQQDQLAAKIKKVLRADEDAISSSARKCHPKARLTP
jgi:PAS domain S-box-containing protein